MSRHALRIFLCALLGLAVLMQPSTLLSIKIFMTQEAFEEFLDEHQFNFW